MAVCFWDLRSNYFNGCWYETYKEDKNDGKNYRVLVYLKDNYLYKKEIYTEMFDSYIDTNIYNELFK